jgi:hypothetical protein
MIVDFQHHFTPRELFNEDLGSRRILQYDETGAPSYTSHALLYDLDEHIRMMDLAGIAAAFFTSGAGMCADLTPDAGYRKEVKTFFVCEGITHYFSPHAVDAVFRYAAGNAAVGSQLVFTYIHRGILDGSATFAGADKTLATVRRAGEPYTFGFDPVGLSIIWRRDTSRWLRTWGQPHTAHVT